MPRSSQSASIQPRPNAPAHGLTLEPPFRRADHTEKGKTSWHVLRAPERTLPVFFCSSSPSSYDRGAVLIRRILDKVPALRSFLTTTEDSIYRLPPESLEFDYGALDDGEWHEIRYRAGELRYRSGAPTRKNETRNLVCLVTREGWTEFWRALDTVGVWN